MDKKVHKLKIKAKPDFYLLGISSHENDYRLSWAINNALGVRFMRIQNLVNFSKPPDENQEFSTYEFENEETLVRYNLISNRCDNGFLLSEYKNIDYFMLIIGKITEDEINRIIYELKKIEIVTTAFQIVNLSAKSAAKFILQ